MARCAYLLYQPYKWLLFLPVFILSTVFFILLGMIILACSDADRARRTAGVWWSRFACFMTPVCVTVHGRRHAAAGQSYVIVANHSSLYDILVLYGFLGIDIKWVMKVQLLKVPLFGLAGSLGGNIFIDRSNPAAAYESLRGAKESLAGGISVMMLPEGTRSKTGELGHFKNGAFVLSSELNIPVLPVSITGTADVLPPHTLRLFPGRVSVTIHPPVHPDAYPGDIDAFRTAVRDTIRDGIGRHDARQPAV